MTLICFYLFLYGTTSIYVVGEYIVHQVCQVQRFPNSIVSILLLLCVEALAHKHNMELLQILVKMVALVKKWNNGYGGKNYFVGVFKYLAIDVLI